MEFCEEKHPPLMWVPPTKKPMSALFLRFFYAFSLGNHACKPPLPLILVHLCLAYLAPTRAATLLQRTMGL